MGVKNHKYAEVLLPLALPKSYTYLIPEKFSDLVRFGVRVEVSLKNKFYSGLIVTLHEDIQNPGYALKSIISVIDKTPIIDENHFALWKWIAAYYMCTLGEVMNAALPTGLKMSSETIIELLPEPDIDIKELSDDEYLVYEAVELRRSLNIREIKEILGRSTVFNVIQTLIDKELVNLKEELIDSYKPKKIRLIKLADQFSRDEGIHELLEKFKRSKHKTNALLTYYQLSKKNEEILKTDLMEVSGAGSSVIKELVDKDIFIESDKTISRLKTWNNKLSDLPQLSDTQRSCINEMDKFFDTGNHLLLHGVTGSGKTRIYQEFIARTISNGGQVLYLVPEIGLTTQMINRLTSVFGDEVYVFHSKLNQQERVEIWNSVHQGKSVILAARSGIFLPFRNLQLIIVDEEHDSSYKQQSPSPHYNARDIASYLGTKLNIKVILGSATPSLESYYNCLMKKYAYVKIDQRFGDVSLPEIRISDMRIKSALLPDNSKYSIALVSMIQQSLNNDEQVLLFQNRRGFAPTILCNTCGWNAKCPNCDVSLTLHKNMGELKCHYCGYRKNTIDKCPACGSIKIGHLGYGTEKIELELRNLFPDSKVKRMDLDTVRTKNDVETLMNEFEEKKIDILVGTQMITKGLDFEKIGLVGIVDIDKLMQFPDFRANERAFQLAVQVGGRAGRRKKQGLVIIQTHDPVNPLLKDILNSDFESFSTRELEERERYHYPPYVRIIEITIMHSKYDKCRAGSIELAGNLRTRLKTVLGPAVPGIGRLRGLYQFSIILKIGKYGTDLSTVRKAIDDCKKKVLNTEEFKSLKINIDVDPY
ncbi:MAG: primosomal protein N' [Saprospiraceae bacterium]|nr:primosomal protein N' [Saprospiraceae bacterium]